MGRAYQNRKESMAKTSDAKAKVYSKYGRVIYVCAKEGGLDPEGNLALRGLIERAKKDQVPSHVIEKALKKARGVGGEDFFVARYEGFAPGGAMVIIDCLTDNPNRTFGDVRQCFTKTKCKIGTEGSVSHLFDHICIFVIKGEEEMVLDILLNADVDVLDIENDDGMISIFAPHTDYAKAKTALSETIDNINFEVDEIQFSPKITNKIKPESEELFNQFLEMLNDLDDVQNIYHDIDLSTS